MRRKKSNPNLSSGSYCSFTVIEVEFIAPRENEKISTKSRMIVMKIRGRELYMDIVYVDVCFDVDLSARGNKISLLQYVTCK